MTRPRGENGLDPIDVWFLVLSFWKTSPGQVEAFCRLLVSESGGELPPAGSGPVFRSGRFIGSLWDATLQYFEQSEEAGHAPSWDDLMEALDLATRTIVAVFGGRSVRLKVHRHQTMVAADIERALSGGRSVDEAARAVGVSRASAYRHLRARRSRGAR